MPDLKNSELKKGPFGWVRRQVCVLSISETDKFPQKRQAQ